MNEFVTSNTQSYYPDKDVYLFNFKYIMFYEGKMSEHKQNWLNVFRKKHDNINLNNKIIKISNKGNIEGIFHFMKWNNIITIVCDEYYQETRYDIGIIMRFILDLIRLNQTDNIRLNIVRFKLFVYSKIESMENFEKTTDKVKMTVLSNHIGELYEYYKEFVFDEQLNLKASDRGSRF